MSRHRISPLTAITLAFALVLAQTFAVAHEYDHALGQHDVPCALHAFADHAGKGLIGALHGVSPARITSAPACRIMPSRRFVAHTAFHPRAPPAHS